MIAITGASSFTGSWIAEAFVEAGWSVQGLCSRDENRYHGIRRLRLERLRSKTPLHFGIDATTGAMERWIKEFRPSLWLHHYHYMENFRSADYNLEEMERICLKPLPGIVNALAESGCKGILFSGTYFEPGEGGQEAPDTTPYGKSKSEVWQNLVKLSQRFSLPLSKVVIPNPIGPQENVDRLIPQLLRTPLKGPCFLLNRPETKMDNIPVKALGRIYVDTASRLLAGETLIVRPSGWVGTAGEWVKKVQQELKKIPVEFGPTTPRSGHENPSTQRRNYEWQEVWSLYRSMLDCL